jgi:hypothetical protein
MSGTEKALALLQNIRLGWKDIPEKNTPAYLRESISKREKMFSNIVNDIKRFSLLLTIWLNKLERF